MVGHNSGWRHLTFLLVAHTSNCLITIKIYSVSLSSSDSSSPPSGLSPSFKLILVNKSRIALNRFVTLRCKLAPAPSAGCSASSASNLKDLINLFI
jgi:hypothetical protein